MSATIYIDGLGDKGAILPVRSGFTRQFNLGTWFDLTIGIICNVTNDVDNSSSTINGESSMTYAPTGNFFFGVADSYVAGVSPDFVNFQGLSTTRTAGVTELSNSYNYIDLMAYTEVVNSVHSEQGLPFRWDYRKGTSDPIYQYYVIRFLRKNPTAANTKVIFAQGTTAVADTTTLRNFMEGIGTTGGENMSNIANLNHLVLYWPFQENRIKIHNVGAIRTG